MNKKTIVLTVLLIISIFAEPVAADGPPLSPVEIPLLTGETQCYLELPRYVLAKFYSYQVPIVVRNELGTSSSFRDVWAYGDACVKQPLKWDSSQRVTPYFREGKTWSNLSIYESFPADVWQASFPPNEEERSKFLVDNFASLGERSVYIPAFGSYLKDDVRVSLANLPLLVPVGISHDVATTLKEAGMIVENGRVWLEYSNNSLARQGRDLKPLKAIFRWENAYSLLCDPVASQKRKDNNSKLARILMIRNPAFPWDLADEFDCRSSSDKDDSGRRKWGGGILVVDLFPNLELAPLEIETQDGYVSVQLRVQNQSPVSGSADVYYRWESTGVWNRYGEDLPLEPYQNTSRGKPVDPFVMRLPGPENPDKLTVLIWSDSSGLATDDPDLGKVTSAVLSQSGGLDRVFESYNRELTLQDNVQSATVQPVFCGDLTVSVSAPGRASADGFTFTVTATRQGCETLKKVVIDATVNGITQRQEVAFQGQTAAATFDSGPQYGEYWARIQASVDPDNLVRESNEANNWAERTVELEEEWLTEIVCPYGEPSEKCFRSRLYN